MNNFGDPYTKLARSAVESHVKSGSHIQIPQNLPEEFYSRRAGVFVTIFRGKELRGCIGTYHPSKGNLAEELVANAIAAAIHDYRFVAITSEELPFLRYEVSVLGEPKKISDPHGMDPKKNGVIVQCGDGRCGLLLPDIEGVTTFEQQVFIACQKGEINLFEDKPQLFSFTVEKHAESEE